MSEQEAETAVKAPFNGAESELHGLVTSAAAGGVPAKLCLEAGTIFVIGTAVNLPAFLMDASRTMVLVSGEEYRELVGLRTRLLRQDLEQRKQPKRPAVRLGLSTIERDAEVADWLRERFHGGITVAQLHAACLERFGAERTPSASRISSFRRSTGRGQ